MTGLFGRLRIVNLPNLDYTALSTPQLAKRPISVQQVLTIGYAVVFLGFVLLLLGDAYIALSTLMVVVIPLVFFGVIWGFYRIYQQNRLKREALTQFAATNGLTFEQNVAPDQAGFMFHHGSDRLIESRLIIPTDGHPVEIGNYQYETGSGKSRTTHDLGYMRLKLPRRVPHMVLDAKANNFMAFSNLPAVFDKRQVLELEGDFNKYFTLYVPKQYERDALYVFTPDVMLILVELAGNYDVELVDDELYVYSSVPFQLVQPAVLQGLLTLASRLSPEFTSQTDRYADERIANFNANIIAEPGRRLKRRFGWLGLAVFLAYMVLSIGDDFMPDAVQSTILIFFGVVFWGYGVWILIRKFRGWN